MRKWLLIWPLLMLPFFGTSQDVEKPCFSAVGGFYETSFILEITPANPQHHIRFTTNGNRPTAQSRLYTEPLLLDGSLYSDADIYTIQVAPDDQMFYPDSVKHCIVIRAAEFDDNDSCVSEVKTNSYFIRSLGCDTHGLPVMSLCSDSLGLFDYYTGIMVPGRFFYPTDPNWTGNYFCKGANWERTCNVEFYELNNRGINQIAGLKTHGGASRRQQQKGFKILAKEEFGEKRFKHNFFSQTPVDSFKHLSLKPFRCSHWMTTGLQDALAQQLARSLDLETLCSRQMVLFLNGEYWGIYALQEVPDEHFLEDHYEADQVQCNIIKKWKELDCGDSTHWHDFFGWMSDADLSLPENYDFATAHIDVSNFIDYQIFELFSMNVDWPANNVRCWQEGDGKWRWFFYDGDGCFFRDWDAFSNAIDTSQAVFPSNARSTLFFRKMIQNPVFFKRFESRFQQVMSNQLRNERLTTVFDSLCSVIVGEVPFTAERFSFPADMEKWAKDTASVNTLLERWTAMVSQRLNAFSLAYELPESFALAGLSCFPNPTSDAVVLSVVSDAPKTSQLLVFDAFGRQVCQQSVSLEAGSNLISLDLPFPPGLYFLKIDHLVTKIIRQ